MKFEYSREILEKYSYINFMKIRPVQVELFHVERRTDGRTDVTKLTVAFRNFAKAPKNSPYRMSKTQFTCLDIIDK
jgi:hypothetical protein